MKNKGKPPAPKRAGKHAKHGFVISHFCADYDIPRNTFDDWVANEGCPTDSKANTLRWMLTHKPSYLKVGSGSQDQAQWTAADWKKFKLEFDAKTAQHRYEVERGEVHSKAECCKWTASVFSDHLQPLISLHSKVAARFPELSAEVVAGIASDVDAAMASLKASLEANP